MAELMRGDVEIVLKAGGDLRGVDLSGLDLSGLDFSGARLRGVNFSYCNLAGANFSKGETSFSDRNILTRVNFSGANLENANFYRCKFWFCTFNGTRLDGANLLDIRGTTPLKLVRQSKLAPRGTPPKAKRFPTPDDEP